MNFTIKYDIIFKEVNDLGLKEKRKIIKDNKSACVAAITGYLDKMYYLTDEKRLLDVDSILEPKTKDFLSSLKEEEVKFEAARQKIIQDEDLSLFEINLVRLALVFSKGRMEEQIENYNRAIKIIDKINNVIVEKT